MERIDARATSARGGAGWGLLRAQALLAGVLTCGLALAGGCSGDVAGSGPQAMVVQSCVPGLQIACPCPLDPTRQGVQVCDALTRTLGACDCGLGPIAGAGTAGVMSTAGVMAGDGVVAGTTGGVAGDVGAGGAMSTAGVMAGDGAVAGAVGGMVPAMPLPPLASEIRIAEIAVYQAVKVSLAKAGQAVIARNAPVIVGKEAFLRVSVEPLPGFMPRDIEAVLTLSSSEGPAAPQQVTKRVAAASSDASLDSTINFNIPGDHITTDLRYAVELREASGMAAAGSVDPAARFPTEASALIELGARDAGPLRVMVVPYRYQGDGSGRLPDVSDTQIDLFQRYLHSYYPASQIELTLHEPVTYNNAVGPQTGWEQWLEFHCALRAQEEPDPKVLYYGVMSPRETWRAYGGGIAGISPVPNPASNYGRCSVGLGFTGAIAAGTMAHELGHSLGLPHAPCGVSGGPFPYSDGKIGVWGYSLAAAQLRDPNQYHDLMSYCDPAFISDFNFEKLFERIRYLNLQFDELRSARPTRYARVLREASGRLSATGYVDLTRAPAGEEDARLVRVRTARGVVDDVTGYFLPFSEEPTGVWLVPASAGSHVELSGQTVVLP